MAAIFLDTSALVRRYDRSEPGAARVRAICAPSRGNTLLLARVASVEVASALARKVRDGTIRAGEQDRLWRLFRAHWRDQYQVMVMTEEAYGQAERVLTTSPLRALDAIHLGCALVLAANFPKLQLEFWTGDKRQARAARDEGLGVELVV